MRDSSRRGGRALFFLLAVLAALSSGRPGPAAAQSPTPDSTRVSRSAGSKFLDPGDGWFDLSAFLDSRGGFVPIAVPITEPAVGFGVAGGLVFIDRNPPLPGGGYRKPNMLLVGGLGTDDGSWAGFAGHTGSWLEDRLQTVVAGIYGSFDLDFFGIGEGPRNDHPLGYDLDPAGGLAQAKYRIGRTPFQAGFGYGLIGFEATFESKEKPEGVTEDELVSRVGGVTPALFFDSRDNLFTPSSGAYGSLEGGLFREWLGGSSDFERVRLMAIVFRPMTDTVFLGVRGVVASSFGDAPFYARPFVLLRGAPIMAYLGESAASVEVEARWQFWNRISAVGFTGAGSAWNEFADFENQRNLVTGGAGARYEIARRYGLHMGLDVAWGPDEPAFYVQFGNAWFRP